MKKLLALILALMLIAPAAMADVTFPLEETATLSIALQQSPLVNDYEDNALTKWLFERTNVQLEFVLFPSTDAATKLNLMISGGDKLPDILTFGLNATTAYEWGSEGVLVPLNDYFDNDGQYYRDLCASFGFDADDLLKQITSVDGNIYGTPVYMPTYNNMSSPSRGWINQDWLDAVGMTAPTTYDELVAVLTAFQEKDPNGNGQADEIPMTGPQALKYIENMFIYSPDGNHYLPLNETDGKLDVDYDKPAYREFLKAANDLVARGLLSPLTFTMDNDQMKALLTADDCQVGLFANQVGGQWCVDATDRFSAFEVPAGPEGAQYISIAKPTAGYSAAVTTDCENPDLAIHYLMMQCEPSANASDVVLIERYGQENIDWRRFDPELDKDMQSAIPGITPYQVSLNEVWGVQTSQLWMVQPFFLVGDPAWWVTAVDKDNPTATANYFMGQNYALNIEHGPALEDLVVNTYFAYTDEEVSDWADARTALDTYINEAATRFALGELNPNDDADWNAYLDELGKLQYQEIIAVDQAAYDRKQAL